MSGNHTPGRWRVEDGTTLIWGNCSHDDETTYGMGYPVALAHTQLGSGSPFGREFREDEAAANAHLIAAAPDLLAALKGCIAYRNWELAEGGVVPPELIDTFRNAEAVAAAAEGSS